MQLKVAQHKFVDVKYVKISVAVRYDEEDMPNNAPGRSGDTWEAIVDLDNKQIIDWPYGEPLTFSMKITDQGSYYLLGANKQILAKLVDEYVPNELLPGDDGDYLDLEIRTDGVITNWLDTANFSDFEKDFSDDEEEEDDED